MKRDMEGIKAALEQCSSETRRLITEEVLEIPAVVHMLLVFLSDTSRPFEDWIMEPKCRHRLTQLRDRVDSQDVPALTASYEEQVASAVHARLRTSTAASTSPHTPSDSSPVPEGWADDSSGAAPSLSPQSKNASAAVVGDFRSDGDLVENGTPECTEEKRATTRSVALGGRADTIDANDGQALPVMNGDSPAEKASLSWDEHEELEEDDTIEGEEAYEMLMVMSEAMKEEAKGRFRRSDFMGAAKGYRRAALALDERAPPPQSSASSPDRAAPLRKRLQELYVTCMCNAAVAGFKAANAAPAPGEAHSLVVEACSRALERSGGNCSKARFWRARVKICQHMYEAAEADLQKAVEEEEEQQQQQQDATGDDNKRPPVQTPPRKDEGKKAIVPEHEGTNDRESSGAHDSSSRSSGALNGCPGTAPNGLDSSSSSDANVARDERLKQSRGDRHDDQSESAADGGASDSRKINGHAAVALDATASRVPAVDGAAAANCTRIGRTSAVNGVAEKGAAKDLVAVNGISDKATTNGAVTTTRNVKSGSNGLRSGNGNSNINSRSEASRWLARVRAKIAQMDAARAEAAEQSSARAERASIAREKASAVAQRRSRHGPGHVPAHTSPETSSAGVHREVGAGNGGLQGAADGGKEEEEEGEPVWKVPRPPALNTVGRSPAMLMNDYALQAKFQAVPQYEQVTGAERQPAYECHWSVGPEDRLVGHGRGTNMKAAKQAACVDLLTNAALAWNEENPEALIDMETMVPSPQAGTSKKMKALEAEITDEFKAYVAAWAGKVVREEIHEANFPDSVSKDQRKYIHAYVEGLENPAVLSKSANVKGRRRLSVMLRSMMEGLAFISGDNVVVVDVPGPLVHPADIDLASITRPPPERTAVKVHKVVEQGIDGTKA